MKPVKRTKQIRLVLLGALSAGALSSCSPNQPAAVRSDAVYTNNYYVPGVGYYHAPFNAFYPLPYNHYNPAQKSYFYGGQWGAEPCRSIINISSPSAAAAASAEAQRTDIQRGGFGHTGGYYGFFGG